MFTLSVMSSELVLISPFWKSGTVIDCFSTPIFAVCVFGAFSERRSFIARYTS